MNKILLIFIVWAFGITANAAEVTIEMLNKLDGRSMVFSCLLYTSDAADE